MTDPRSTDLQILDWSAAVDRQDEPFTWAVARDLVPPLVRADVREALPVLPEEVRAVRTMGGDKRYGMFVLPLVDKGVPLPVLNQQGDVLRALVAQLNGETYRGWVGDVLGLDVRDCLFDIGVFHFRRADYITPHTDKPGKVATHVLYFNEDEWLPAYGGAFEVRASADMVEPAVAKIEPAGGRSVIFRRSDRSWHAVSPIAAPDGVVRWTMQVEMWSPGE